MTTSTPSSAWFASFGAAPRAGGVRRFAVAGVVALMLALGACSSGEEEAVDEDPREVFPYDVVFEGDAPAALVAYLEEVSNAAGEADDPPNALTLVRRRGDADLPRLEQALAARGYYAGTIEARTRRIPEDEREETVIGFTPPVARITYDVTTGPIYRLRALEIVASDPENGFVPPPPRALGLDVGAAAEAQPVIDAVQAVVQSARDRGFAFAAAASPVVVVEHPDAAMDVRIEVETGPLTRLAPARFTGGGEDVSGGAKHKRAPWSKGAIFSPALISEGRSRLVQTGLYSRVRSVLADQLDDEGLLVVTYELTDRPRRTIGGGARFQTDVGPSVSAYWEHRNIFGGGERLRVDSEVSLDDYSLRGSFRRLDFSRRDQNLLADASVARLVTDAFETDSIAAGVGVERRLTPETDVTLGLRFRAVDVTQDGDTESFALISTPASIDWDGSDDLLDPTEGARFRLFAAPFFDALGSGANFFKTRAVYSHYLEVVEEPRIILAGRGALGAIVGAQTTDIPADERFYAGGGGSVRGYAFQQASPTDASGALVGGRSLLELAAEARVQATESIGVVFFLDAGSAFDLEIPNFDEPLQFGAGVGLRYGTPIGPLRLDVGFPLNSRETDDAFQAYVSIGQAF